MQDRYDVIIIGGGSAGCAAATRLSEDPNRRVLLLEAGQDPDPIPEIIADAALQTQLLLESDFIEMYPTRRSIDDSVFYNLAGRVMGGGSSVNVMSLPRPMKYDLDTWAALGNPDWSYERLLPVMKRIESDQDFPDSPIHGSGGPLYVKRPFTLEELAAGPVKAVVERALAMGLPPCPDLNVPEPLGVCASPYNIKDGRRQSTTVAYLSQARSRANLQIVSEAQVSALNISDCRVESLVYRKDGQTHTVSGDQVVLSAGCYHTPQILMLSGIGPAKELERLGIPVVSDLPGVGENFQDHAMVHMTFEGPTGFPSDWVIPRVRMIIKSDPSRPCANFHIMVRPPTEVAGLKRMMPISAALLEQRNRGRVRLNSADPDELPQVEAHMLEDPADVEAMVNAMKFIHELARHDSMKELYGPLLQPTPKDDWARFAQSTYDSYHHGSGTCMMGPTTNPMTVVDQHLHVHGMDNLWVADASIMPTVVHANTNLTSIMIGELLSDFLITAQ